MRVSTSILAFVVALINIPITSHAADAIPDFDIFANCRIALLDSGGTGETLNTCTEDEQRAKRQLTQEWSRFAKEDKLRCIQETNVGDMPSYIELQTCLQMAADNPARSIQGFDRQMRTNTN
jgi:hypothetical protein